MSLCGPHHSAAWSVNVSTCGPDVCPVALPSVQPVGPKGRAVPFLRLGCKAEPWGQGWSQTHNGVFGRCQKVPAMDSHRYEVSRGARQHLTATLQKLSRTGRESLRKFLASVACRGPAATLCFCSWGSAA
uniref:Uncharacterized protein n=1 Tax=Neovison vison TaxID=452646 RepID=A0A8C7C3Y1_NEOVI